MKLQLEGTHALPDFLDFKKKRRTTTFSGFRPTVKQLHMSESGGAEYVFTETHISIYCASCRRHMENAIFNFQAN